MAVAHDHPSSRIEARPAKGFRPIQMSRWMLGNVLKAMHTVIRSQGHRAASSCRCWRMTMIERGEREAVEATPRKAVSTAVRDMVVARQRARCARCGEDQVFWKQDDATHVYHPMQIDHILPLELGGDDDIANYQALCIPCHKAKTREDVRRIRKAARLRRDADPETRRRSRTSIRSRGFRKADDLK